VDVPLEQLGRRLSDAIRAALDSGDAATARRLAVEGDGQARNLAKEYGLMYRGLGITIRILLGLIGETAARADASSGQAAAQDAAAVVHGFHTDFSRVMERLWGDAPSAPEAQGTLDEESACAARVLDLGQERFEREQARLAGEVVQAIEAGDIARARALVDLKEQGQYVPLHDRMVRFMAESFGWVLRWFGPGELLRFHLATAEAQRPGFEKWEQMSAAEFTRATAFLLKQHMGQFLVREDDEKFTIEQTPCGSGGRLRLKGAYEGPDALPFVEAPGPLTFGEPRLPVYCSHCPIWNGTAPLAWFGRAHWVFENASRPDGGCTLHIYKRHDGTPPEYAGKVRIAKD
jgi:hypothetical protein